MPPPKHPTLNKLLIRFLLVGIVTIGMGATFADDIVRSLLPGLQRGINAISSDFTVLDSRVDIPVSKTQAREGAVFRANLRHVVLVDGKFVYPLGEGGRPSGWYQVNLTTGGILQHALFLLTIVMAWPGKCLELAFRVALGIPIAAMLVYQHTAITVLAELWFPIHDELAGAEFWPLLTWSRLLMAGGGLVISMTLGALIILVSNRLSQEFQRVRFKASAHVHGVQR